MSPVKRDCYEVLGVPRDADERAIIAVRQAASELSRFVTEVYDE